MDLYCEKQMKSTIIYCKKHLVIIELGIAKIIYYRLYPDKHLDGRYKPTKVDENIINGIYKLFEGNEITNENLKDLIENIKHTYYSLKKHGKQDTTLPTLTQYFSDKSKTPLNFDYGIVMKDKSIVFFYDSSDIISGNFDTVFINGGLK